MTVLYLNPGAQMGGAETSLVDLLAAVREAHPEWRLCLWTGEDGPLLRHAERLGVETRIVELPEQLAQAGDSGLRQKDQRFQVLFRIFGSASAAHRYGSLLRRAVAELKPNLVHATGLKMQILGAAYLAGRHPVLWHIHDYVSWRPVASRLLSLFAGRVRGAIINSDSVLEDLRSCCPRIGHLRRIYNAIDASGFAAAAPADLDAHIGAPAVEPGTVRIALVATYARWKGHLTYLDALERLPRDRNWRAYVVGGAIYKTAGSQFSSEELQENIRARGLEERVFLTGFLSDRASVMQALDIVVHASTKPEPFGMVVLEAMACGKAVVASRSGGTMEIFSEDKDGLGHEPANADELAKQIERLMNDASLRTRLGEAGRLSVASRFSRANLASQLTEEYMRCQGHQ